MENNGNLGPDLLPPMKFWVYYLAFATSGFGSFWCALCLLTGRGDPALQAVCDPRGAYCGYWGALTTCTHHLADCKNHNNVSRFGGYPGVGTQGFLSTTPT